MAKSKAIDVDQMKAVLQSGAYIPLPLKNVILQYPHLDRPDTEFDPGGIGKFKCNAVVSDDVATDMEACGFKVYESKDGEKFVKMTRQPKFGKVPIEDEDGNEIDPKIIGNGTVATIEASTKYWKVGKEPSQSIYMNKIIVHDLVKYEGTGGGKAVDFF